MAYIPGLPGEPLDMTQVVPHPVQTAPGRTSAETGERSETAQPAKSATDNDSSQIFFITLRQIPQVIDANHGANAHSGANREKEEGRPRPQARTPLPPYQKISSGSFALRLACCCTAFAAGAFFADALRGAALVLAAFGGARGRRFVASGATTQKRRAHDKCQKHCFHRCFRPRCPADVQNKVPHLAKAALI